MKKIVSLILILSIFSCNRKESSTKIEIYFLKNRIQSVDGIPLKDFSLYKKLQLDSVPYYANRKNEKYDTIAKGFLSEGKFTAKINDLVEKPFIEDFEIEYLNKEKSEIKFNDSGFKKLLKLDLKTDNKRQFVITVNKRPVLTGYLISEIASIGYCDNFMVFDDQLSDNNLIITNHPFKIQHNKSHEKTNLMPISLKNYSELVNAFEKTDRLK